MDTGVEKTMRQPPPPPAYQPAPAHFSKTVTREYSSSRDRDKDIARMTRDGWTPMQMTAMAGNFRGGRACCLFAIFPPLALLAGRTDDRWVVIYGR